MNIRRTLIPLMFAGVMAVSPLAAQVYVRVGPPRPLYERRVPPPGRGYVWTPGYQRWDGRAYGWVPGAWVLPPRPHAHWVAAHWVHRRGGWLLVEGHWR
jgi:WXXGXW repeat (2 copies)